MSAKAEHYDVIRKPIITEKERFRGQLGTRKDVKKAYVTLVEGNTIDVSTGL